MTKENEEICENCERTKEKHYQDIAGMPLMCEPFGIKKFKLKK